MKNHIDMMRFVVLIVFWSYFYFEADANFASFFCYGDVNHDSILNDEDLTMGRPIAGRPNLAWLSEFKQMIRDQGNTTKSPKIPHEMAHMENNTIKIKQDITLEDFKKMSTAGRKNYCLHTIDICFNIRCIFRSDITIRYNMTNSISEEYAGKIEEMYNDFECCLEPGAWWDGCYEEPLPGEGLQCGCSKAISYL